MRKIITLICFIWCISTYSQKHFEHLPPTKENILKVLKYHDVKYPKYVLAQAIQETSLKPKKHNNLFGLSHSKGLYKYSHWSYSVISYKNKIQSRYKTGEDYLKFLKRIKYAEDPNYISKISKISKTL